MNPLDTLARTTRHHTWPVGHTPADFVLGGVRAVLADRILDDAHIVVRSGRIAEIGTGAIRADVDGQGLLVLPGLIDVHSDALEKERAPRPTARLPWDFTIASFEGRLLGAGVTTMFHGAGFQHKHARGVRREPAAALELCRALDAHTAPVLDHRILHRLDVLSGGGAEALRTRLGEVGIGEGDDSGAQEGSEDSSLRDGLRPPQGPSDRVRPQGTEGRETTEPAPEDSSLRDGLRPPQGPLSQLEETGGLRPPQGPFSQLEETGGLRPPQGTGVPPLVSHEDHTPGQGQYVDPSNLVAYIVGADHKTEAEAWEQIEQLRTEAIEQAPVREANLAWLGELARAGRIRLMGHDPDTPEAVDALVERGATVAEFPTTLAAAERAREHGLLVVAGAPNLMRGGSHAGNVSALDLARRGLVDALASDYLPPALLGAVSVVAPEIGLPAAVRLVTDGPARVGGLADRGVLAEGHRADLALVDDTAGNWLRVARVLRPAGRQP